MPERPPERDGPEDVVEIGESASQTSAQLAAVTGLALMAIAAFSLIGTEARPRSDTPLEPVAVSGPVEATR